MAIIATFALLALFLATRMPVAFALGVCGMIGLYLTVGGTVTNGLVGIIPFRNSASLLLTTIPMFILMAELLSQCRIIPDVFKFVTALVGRVRGGLAMATILANAGLGSVSGSSSATTGALASITVPRMRAQGYSSALATGVVSAAGTLAVMLPPSIPLIIYGITTETSIGKLFIAGIVPGIITAVSYAVVVYIWGARSPETVPVGERYSWRQKVGAARGVWPAFVLMGIVLGGIYSGAITPTEAGAVGAVGAFIIAVAVGGLRFDGFIVAVRNAIRITAMVIIIVIGASLFGAFLVASGLTEDVLTTLVDSGLPSMLIVVLIVGVYLFLGAIMDELAILLLTLPLTFPLVTGLGYDPIWWGVVVVKTVQIGLEAPPVGMNVFVVSGISGVPLQTAYRGAIRFILAELVVLALLLAIPSISTFLPTHMG